MVDGYHIACLWIVFFYRYYRPIIENGYFYIACPPKYKIVLTKDLTTYAFNEEERDKILAEHNNKFVSVTYLKGLGEMNADQLWETSMNPENRKLIQVTIEDAEEAEKYLSICMSEETNLRKQWIFENAEFYEEESVLI